MRLDLRKLGSRLWCPVAGHRRHRGRDQLYAPVDGVIDRQSRGRRSSTIMTWGTTGRPGRLSLLLFARILPILFTVASRRAQTRHLPASDQTAR